MHPSVHVRACPPVASLLAPAACRLPPSACRNCLPAHLYAILFFTFEAVKLTQDEILRTFSFFLCFPKENIYR
jgi:hypothetical protein